MINNVRGTHDVIGSEANAYSAVENMLKHIAELFSFQEVRPPVLEHSELFVRGVGEGSDVVRKEMYTFLDKGERSLTLRPEFTAGIIRLIVQNKLYADREMPFKAYYCGPVFRYERPSLGRYRQFNQFGVESVGCNNYLNDIEVISMAYIMLNSLGLENVKLKINTLGDAESRDNYKKALKEFFATKINDMCPDCQQRFEINPLRILDCKVPEDQEIVKNAPKMSDYLSKESKDKFDSLVSMLDELNIEYEIDDTLVRGLDYYSDVVFEFHYQSTKGNNYGAIGAGGHYDRLVAEIGGPDIPGVGFSFGVERLVSVLVDDNLLPNVDTPLDIYVMPIGVDSQKEAMITAVKLRLEGYTVDYCFDDVKMGAQFKRAERKNAKLAIIIGENEINNNEVVVKNLKTKEQTIVKNDNLLSMLEEMLECCEGDCGCHCNNDCCCENHVCDCDHDCKCHDCGHECGEMPCKETGACPCGKNYKECECVVIGKCQCKNKK